MSDYTTYDYRLSDMNEVARTTGLFIKRKSAKDREIILTKWIDMLLDLGVASTKSHASVIIGKQLGLSKQRVLSYYKGGK